MNANDVAALAEQHRVDRDALRKALYRAGFFYASRDFDQDATDTLDKVKKPATQLMLLLWDEVNQQRLIDELIDEREPPTESTDDDGMVCLWNSPAVIDEVLDKFDEMLRALDALRAAACRAHQKRGRGRPRRKQDLRAAYLELASFWKRSRGEDEFTQGWDTERTPITPTSPAACFLYDAMKLIDPRRPRLAEELRALMPGDVRKIPGDRRGRRRNLR